MIWAVLADEMDIARYVLPKTLEPMRYAIWAAHLANFKSQEKSLNATKRAEWLEAAKTYEQWAVGILDQEESSESAMQQLTFAHARFEESVIDHALVIDDDAFPCRAFVSHPHCQDLAARYFNGDFPGSKAVVRNPTTLGVILHTLSFGLITSLRAQHPGEIDDNNQDSKNTVGDQSDTDDDDDENDSPLAITGKAARRVNAPQRYFAVINVPFCRFVNGNVCTIAYTTYLAASVCGWPWEGATWMVQQGYLKPRIQQWEYVTWSWTILRCMH